MAGLRLGELLGLQWQDVDLHEGVLHIRRQFTRLDEYTSEDEGSPSSHPALRGDEQAPRRAEAPLAALEGQRSGVRGQKREAAQASERHSAWLRSRRQVRGDRRRVLNRCAMPSPRA